MQVFQKLTKNKNLVIALGYFDGIHIGHKKIISILVKEAKLKNTKSAIITFQKNPADYFNKEETPSIQTYKDKENLLEAMGVDYLYELDFENYKDISASEYINILYEYFEPLEIIVGYNHTFGKDRSGNPSLLKEFASNYKYECTIVPQQKYNDKEEVSSSIIRKKIQYGHLSAIKALLGRHFSVRNSVIKGEGLARKLGFPTANIIWPNSMAKLPYGVYHGYTQVNTKMYPSLISWGTKPTLSDGQNEILEAYIDDFNENLYGKIIKVIFIKKVRDEENFGNIRVLQTQLQKDYRAFIEWKKTIN